MLCGVSRPISLIRNKNLQVYSKGDVEPDGEMPLTTGTRHAARPSAIEASAVL